MKTISLNYAPIQSEIVREFVRKRIDFPLTNDQWLVIDVAMGQYWNNRKKGAWICNGDNALFIFDHCCRQKLLISYERVLKITCQIWFYLEMKGRLLEN
jgi:hypothetical protein